MSPTSPSNNSFPIMYNPAIVHSVHNKATVCGAYQLYFPARRKMAA